jgi:hypothetical protein
MEAEIEDSIRKNVPWQKLSVSIREVSTVEITLDF